MIARACLFLILSILVSCGESEAERQAREAREFFNILYFAVIVCSVFTAIIFWGLDLVKQKRQALINQQLKEEAQRQSSIARERDEAQKRIEILRRARESLQEFIAQLFVDCLIIDSNIWMNENYASFFATLVLACKKANKKIILPEVQFEEINNIKKNNPFGSSQSNRARTALDWIEFFQKEELLEFGFTTSNIKRTAYADPELIQIACSAIEKDNRVCFISDDKELRIRVRESLSKITKIGKPKLWDVIEMESLAEVRDVICKAYKIDPEFSSK